METSISEGSIPGLQGIWLRSDRIEAFIGTDPFIRLAVLQEPGGPNLLRESPAAPFGLRTWIMNPAEDLEDRNEVAELPAAVVTMRDSGITLETGTSNKLGLRLEWEVDMNAESGALRITHTLINASDTTQELSVWAIAVLAEGTEIEADLNDPDRIRNPRFPYRLYLFPYSSLKDPRVEIAEDHLRASVSKAPETPPLKLGFTSASGSFTCRIGSIRLSSRMAFDAEARYPEGGANQSIFLLGESTECFGEIEHMGGLTQVSPGARLSLTQSLSVHRSLRD